jgi:GNAT superfamily N-acetyltransferase
MTRRHKDDAGTVAKVDDFARYLASLVGSWEALAAPHPDAVVIRRDGFVAARFPHSVLNNAAVFDRTVLAEVCDVYAGVDQYALWSRDSDAAVSAALESKGFRRDVTTRPMHRRLEGVATEAGDEHRDVLYDGDPARIADLNGVPADLLHGVSGLRAYAYEDYRAGLVLVPVDHDVNVSFVATLPDARRRGLASALVRVALVDAREQGFLTASLQATPMAERLYARLGFEPVGRWQEWLPQRRPTRPDS